MATKRGGVWWLDRSLLVGPCFCLCVSEAEFQSVMRYLKIKNPPEWIIPGKDATAHYLECPSGVTRVVCIRASKQHSLPQIHAMLVHEAVHIWQSHRRDIGEANPGDETEAYSIQSISQRLMESYAESTKTKRKQGK